MADLLAQLQLQFGIPPTLRTFDLELDQRDEVLNRPVVVKPYSLVNWLLPEDQIDDPSEFDNHDILVPTTNGYTNVRLYAPLDVSVQLIATEPPIPLEIVQPAGLVTAPISAGITGSGTQYFRPKTVYYGGQAGFGGSYTVATVIWVKDEAEVVKGLGKTAPQVFIPDWEYAGVQETTVMETIQFEFERFKFIKYNYATGIEPMFVSEFLNVNNEVVPPPQFRPDLGGVLLAEQDVVGAVMFRYNVPYRLYRINYSLPHGRQFPLLQRAWLSGDITRANLPPVIVVAMSDEHKRIARTQFNKKVYPNGAYLQIWSQAAPEKPKEVTIILTERSRKVEKVKIFDPATEPNPNDPTTYILVERAQEMVLTDVNGKDSTYKFLKPATPPA